MAVPAGAAFSVSRWVRSQHVDGHSVSPIMSQMSKISTESSVSSPAGTPSAAVKPGPSARVPLFSAEAWSPLKVDLFRSLYIATSVAQIGTMDS